MRTVILLIDASLSMGALDAVRLSGDEEPVTRIALAAELARELVNAMPEEVPSFPSTTTCPWECFLMKLQS